MIIFLQLLKIMKSVNLLFLITLPQFIFFMGYLPLWIAEKQNMTTVLTQNTPLMLENLMRLGMIGMILIAFMSVIILPPLPLKHRKSVLALPSYNFSPRVVMRAFPSRARRRAGRVHRTR